MGHLFLVEREGFHCQAVGRYTTGCSWQPHGLFVLGNNNDGSECRLLKTKNCVVHGRRIFKDHQYLNVVFTGHFCLVWGSNFVGSESGQKQSVKLLESMVYNTTQQPPPSPTVTHTVCIYCTFSLGREVGGQREGRGATMHKYSSFVHWGQQFTSCVENTNHE